MPKPTTEELMSDVHWLMWDVDSIVGCICGFRADTEWDGGYGDSVVNHLLAVGWERACDAMAEQGTVQIPDNPYQENQ